MKTKIIALFLLFAQIACHKQAIAPDDIYNLPEKSARLIDADNQFGLELFSKVLSKAGPNDNTMISPLSVSLALSMTYNGASGQTKADMEKTLGYAGLTTEQINQSHKALINALRSVDPDVLLEIANAIYYRQGFTVKNNFVTVNQEHYNAAVTPLDFSSPTAVPTINGWVANKTNNKIPTIIEQIDPDLVMILLNAVYFNGIWKYKFNENKTHQLPFRQGNGTQKEVAMMNQENELEYAANNLFSAINLPYGKGQYQMTVILPEENKTTRDVISEMNTANWAKWMKSFTTGPKVVVTMPRFKFSWEMRLNQLLSNMGMEIAFTPNFADFTGIADAPPLYISYVIHKTYVDVNENGTEAAAVTAVGVSFTSLPVDQPKKIYFTVDRPFLFAITEKATGTILFIGEINSPVY